MPRGRFNILMIFICIVGLVFITRLYNLQIVNGEEYLEQSEKRLIRDVTSLAPRGDIYDRYGKLLVTSEIGYNVCLYYTKISKPELNDVLYKIASILEKNDDKIINNFPINFETNEFTKSEEQILTWKTNNRIDKDYNESEIIELFKKKYEIESDDIDYLRKVIPLRYEINIKGYTSYKSVTLANDISINSVQEIEERNSEFSGINISKYPKREYLTGSVASHILGYIGAISKNEYEARKDSGYSQNDLIGKTGIEGTFEEYLKGTNGKNRLQMDSKGRVTEIDEIEESQMGSSVVLTIDIDLQRKCEEVLEEYIKKIREGGFAEKFSDARAGAIVVLDVKSSEVLAMASYPTYNPDEFIDGINTDEYEKYFNNEDRPMFNRALSGTYSPGSTFKMVTLISALESKAITVAEKILAKGRYERGHKPVCWIYSDYGLTHGYVDAITALKVSCNYYFYEISYRTGIDKIAEYAKKFGLGLKTGIELIGESKGTLASKEYMQSLNDRDGKNRTWMVADTLSAGIGQSYNSFTPLQMAYYISTLANRGVKNKITIIKDVINASGESILRDEYENAVLEKTKAGEIDEENIEISENVLNAVYEGMRSVTSDRGGTAYSTFKSFPIEVAGKTGTATASSGSPNAWFIGYAPYDDPKIAVVCIIEHGGHGGYTAPVVKEVMEEYFGYNNDNNTENLEIKSIKDIIN